MFQFRFCDKAFVFDGECKVGQDCVGGRLRKRSDE